MCSSRTCCTSSCRCSAAHLYTDSSSSNSSSSISRAKQRGAVAMVVVVPLDVVLDLLLQEVRLCLEAWQARAETQRRLVRLRDTCAALQAQEAHLPLGTLHACKRRTL